MTDLRGPFPGSQTTSPTFLAATRASQRGGYSSSSSFPSHSQHSTPKAAAVDWLRITPEGPCAVYGVAPPTPSAAAPLGALSSHPAHVHSPAVAWACASPMDDQAEEELAAAAAAADAFGASLSCDGADTRYVEVANERAFAALQLRRSGDGGGAAPSPLFHNPLRSHQGPSLFHSSSPYPPLRDGATSTTLTPVRTLSRTGTPLPSHPHTTPLHNTAYGSKCYNRLLSHALLCESEWQTSVFSAPRQAVVTAVAPLSSKLRASTPRSGRRTEAAGVTPSPLPPPPHAVVRDANYSASLPDPAVPTTAFGLALRAGKLHYESSDGDSASSSTGSSLHPLTTGEGRDGDEEDEDVEEDGTAGGRYASHTFYTRGHSSRSEGAGSPAALRSRRGTQSSTAITSPLSYFQHAPCLSAGVSSPSVRVRFGSSGESAPLLPGSSDDVMEPATPSAGGVGAAWSSMAGRAGAARPLRTAGVVSTSLSLCETSPESVGVARCDTPLLAPAVPAHVMARTVGSSCTPPSLFAAMKDGEEGEEDKLLLRAPACPHAFPATRMALLSSLCTPSTSRPAFILPDFTACEGHRQRGGDVVDSREMDCRGDPFSGVDSPTPPVPSRCDGDGGGVREDAAEAHHTPARSSAATPTSLERGGIGGFSGVARGSLHASPATLLRYPVAAHVLFTPVRHHDNSIYDFHPSTTTTNNSSSAVSPANRFLASPVSPAAVAVSLSPARSSLRYGSAASTALESSPGAAGRRHISPYRELQLSAGARSGVALGGAATTTAGTGGAGGHRHGASARRDAFHFRRAMTASETSTDALHSPFFWGCFGILVVQLAEVWCVGKAQPFRIFPNTLDDAAAIAQFFEGNTTVTAVASTAQLSVASWEEAGLLDGSGSTQEGAGLALPIVLSMASPTTHAIASSSDVVYLAVGTSAGDVRVYAYGRCGLSAPGAIPLSLSAAPAQQHLQPTGCAVKLRRCGTLLRADRVPDTSRPRSEVGADHAAHPHGRAPSLQSNEAETGRLAITVLRIVGSWLYIGDQAGHVARYDLHTARFLSTVAEQPEMYSQQQQQDQQRPMTVAHSASGEASTPAHIPASPNPRIPVHHFARPTAPSVSTAVPPQPQHVHVHPSTHLTPSYHFAVSTGEAVYNLEVTDNNGYLAVGTQTRLLVYRVAEMPRVSDDGVSANPCSPQTRTPLAFYNAMPSPESSMMSSSSTTGGASRHAPSESALEASPPLVVVRDAPQPVRCFAWMLCDYEAFHAAASRRLRDDARDEGCSASTMDGTTERSVYESAERDVAGARGGVAPLLSASTSLHTPAPTLVFACARLWSAEGGAEAIDGTVQGSPSMKTDVQLFRVIKRVVVASCTLDYPVRVLRVVAGTTQIIVGTGSTAEWGSTSSGSPTLPANAPHWTGTPQLSSLPVHSALLTPNPVSGAARLPRPESDPSLMSPLAMPSPVLTFSRSPFPAPRHTTPGAAVAAAALRTLTGEPDRPYSAGLWHTSHTSRTTPRIGTTVATSLLATGGARSGSATGTPDVSSSLQRPRRNGHTTDDDHGFLFQLEACPCAPGTEAPSLGGEVAVCLRARGEIVIGRGESAVSGYLSPAQDQISVLVQPTTCLHRPAGGDGGALSVKVKVWQLTSAGGGDRPMVWPGAGGHAPALASVSHSVESLR